jgi:hypothetical protein
MNIEALPKNPQGAAWRHAIKQRKSGPANLREALSPPAIRKSFQLKPRMFDRL